MGIIDWLFGSNGDVEKKTEESLSHNDSLTDPATDEEKKYKEHKWEDVFEPIKFVNQKGKILCTSCANPIGGFIVTSNLVSLQDELYVTDNDNQAINLDFKGVCLALYPPRPCAAVRNFGQWMNVSQTHINDNKALLVKSTIQCLAGGAEVRIIDSGQRTTISNIKPRLQRNR